MVAVWFFTHEGSEPAEVPLAGDGEPSWASIPAAALIWTDGMATWLPASSFIPSHHSWSNEENNAALPPPDVTETEGTVDDNDDDINDDDDNDNDNDDHEDDTPAAAALRALQAARLIIDERAATSSAPAARTSVFGQVLIELIETERSYMVGLDALLHSYRPALQPLAPTVLTQLFAALSAVQHTSEELLGRPPRSVCG